MLVRADGDGVVVIGQASHAWLSGQIARAWGNESFQRPEPREEVCLAAEQHDVGMAEWDLEPRLHPATGRPQSFMEMSLTDHLALWRRAPAKLVTQSAYAALLVSLHGSALYERRDRARMSPDDARAVQAHLDEQAEWQRWQTARLNADSHRLRRNQRLLWAWDALSLALCLRWPPYETEAVPATDDTDVTLRLDAADGDSFLLAPWPFAVPRLTLRCEGRRLSTRYASTDELRAAFQAARPVVLSFSLRATTAPA